MLRVGKSSLRERDRTDTSGSRQAPPALQPTAHVLRAPLARSSVNLPPAPRRPSRVVSAALLLVLHLVAIELFVHLRTTRVLVNDRLVTLLPTVPPTKSISPPQATESARSPRPLFAPLPPIDVEAPTIDAGSVIAVAPSPSNAAASGNAASAPGPAKLDLAIPKEFYTHPPPLTPAQEAMQDPRSNRLVLTKQEQMDVDFGVVECIAWQREPSGSIYRGPGHWQRVRDVSTNPFTSHRPGQEDRSMECVK
jgi:hypothetical protein